MPSLLSSRAVASERAEHACTSTPNENGDEKLSFQRSLIFSISQPQCSLFLGSCGCRSKRLNVSLTKTMMFGLFFISRVLFCFLSFFFFCICVVHFKHTEEIIEDVKTWLLAIAHANVLKCSKKHSCIWQSPSLLSPSVLLSLLLQCLTFQRWGTNVEGDNKNGQHAQNPTHKKKTW